MKTLTLLLFPLFILSQDCEYYKNEIDDMTGDTVIITVREKIGPKINFWTANPVLSVSAIRVNSTYQISIIHSREKPFSISNGDKVILKSYSGKTIKLNNYNSEISDYSINWDVQYNLVLNDEELDFLEINEIEKIRLYHSEGYDDMVLRESHKWVIYDLLNCVYPD